jgi:hypothetical protein
MKRLFYLIGILLLISSVSALTYTSVYPTEYSLKTVNASTWANANFYPFFAGNPALSLIGAWNPNQWLALYPTAQWFKMNLSTTKIIRRFYYENSHNSGASTTTGVKNFLFFGSNSSESFYNRSYLNVTGWDNLTPSAYQFIEHAGSNIPDPRCITVTNTIAYQYYGFKFADDFGSGDYMGLRRMELQTEDGYAPLDNTPPDSITNLDNSTPSWDNITWTWDNPTTPDFNYTVTWKDNALYQNLTNVTVSVLWNGLTENTAYTISIKTKDFSNNLNSTWVNKTVTTDYAPEVIPTPTPTPTIVSGNISIVISNPNQEAFFGFLNQYLGFILAIILIIVGVSLRSKIFMVLPLLIMLYNFVNNVMLHINYQILIIYAFGLLVAIIFFIAV